MRALIPWTDTREALVLSHMGDYVLPVAVLIRAGVPDAPMLASHVAILHAAYAPGMGRGFRRDDIRTNDRALALTFDYPWRPDLVDPGIQALTHLLQLPFVVSARTTVYDDTVPVVARNPRVLSVGGRRAVGRLLLR
jgi:hypothetical protein